MAEKQAIKVLHGYCDEAYKLYQRNCSGAVRHVAKQMGYPLPELSANQLIDYFKIAGWNEVDESRAQSFADAGRLVVAGKKEPGSGHVVVVLPGGMANSGGYEFVNKKGTTVTAANRGLYPRSCSTSSGNWPGALSDGDKSVRDAWTESDYKKVRYWVAPLYGPV